MVRNLMGKLPRYVSLLCTINCSQAMVDEVEETEDRHLADQSPARELDR